MKREYYINVFFLFVITTILVIGFFKPIINPIDIVERENREANQLPSISLTAFNEKTMQDAYELAYADQLPLSNELKSINNTFLFATKIAYLKLSDSNIYKKIGNYNLFDDYLVYDYEPKEKNILKLNDKIENINKIYKKFKNKDLYVFYIESSSNMNFATNEHSSHYEYVKKNVKSGIKTSAFEIKSFDDLKRYYYRTDHHWNQNGSYEGYKKIIKMIFGDSEKIIEPNELLSFTSIFDGSLARELGGINYFNEHFYAYDFSFKEHDVYKNGEKVNNIVDTKLLKNNNPKYITYGAWYGNDYGLLEYDFKDANKYNLLIIGDSYDNAINELIASHFNKTYVVDLRHYKRSIEKEFNISNFIKNNEIDKILLIGSNNFFTSDVFLVKGID